MSVAKLVLTILGVLLVTIVVGLFVLAGLKVPPPEALLGALASLLAAFLLLVDPRSLLQALTPDPEEARRRAQAEAERARQAAEAAARRAQELAAAAGGEKGAQG